MFWKVTICKEKLCTYCCQVSRTLQMPNKYWVWKYDLHNPARPISALKLWKNGKNVFSYHSSEIRGLRSTKCSSKTLQNLLYFMYKKTREVFFVFHFVQLYIFTLWMPWSLSTFSKFWSVSLEHFVERKPLISEEW